jgi:hypothetical protein
MPLGNGRDRFFQVLGDPVEMAARPFALFAKIVFRGQSWYDLLQDRRPRVDVF